MPEMLPIVAIATLVLLQVPPLPEAESVLGEPSQNEVAPEIEPAKGILLTVTAFVALLVPQVLDMV
jgi:hypothetical protein